MGLKQLVAVVLPPRPVATVKLVSATRGIGELGGDRARVIITSASTVIVPGGLPLVAAGAVPLFMSAASHA